MLRLPKEQKTRPVQMSLQDSPGLLDGLPGGTMKLALRTICHCRGCSIRILSLFYSQIRTAKCPNTMVLMPRNQGLQHKHSKCLQPHGPEQKLNNAHHGSSRSENKQKNAFDGHSLEGTKTTIGYTISHLLSLALIKLN
jgi:hypothetical protein